MLTGRRRARIASGAGAIASAAAAPRSSRLKPASSRVFLDVIPHIRAVPRMETWPDIETRVSEEFERAYHLQTTLDEAIRLSTERTRDLFPKK